MTIRSLCAAAALLACTATAARAQTVYPPPDAPTAAAALSPAALDQLVAPAALYPDMLLAQMLAASTYPLEVVQAHRWLSQPQNASLTNGALVAAVSGQNWDPSVQALVPFPQVLQLMDEHLDWTEQLGEAFLAQPQDVMNAVQRLRHRAELAGNLKISPEQSVVNDGDDITIAADNGQNIYLPSYDAQCVYGPWPYPAAGPVGFAPWSGTCDAGDDTVAFDDGDYVPYGFFLWADMDWGRHCIHVDPNRFALAQPGRRQDDDIWHHDPAHRHGAGYRDHVNAQRFAASLQGEPQFHYYAGFTGPRPQLAAVLPRPAQLAPRSLPPAMRPEGRPAAAPVERGGAPGRR